jgi:hypothetical protein
MKNVMSLHTEFNCRMDGLSNSMLFCFWIEAIKFLNGKEYPFESDALARTDEVNEIRLVQRPFARCHEDHASFSESGFTQRMHECLPSPSSFFALGLSPWFHCLFPARTRASPRSPLDCQSHAQCTAASATCA